MKTMMFSLMFVCCGVSAQDGGFIPAQEIAGGELKLRGFTQVIAENGNGSDSIDWPVFRVKGIYDHGSFGVGSEVNFAEVDEPDSNWLRELWLKAKLSDTLEMKVGRLFIASGSATPTPFTLETIQYPKAALFSCYGWGIQFNHKSEEWEASFDVTGRPGSGFAENENWQSFAASARVKRNFAAGSVAATCQLLEGVNRFGVDAEIKPVPSLTLRGLACYERNSDKQASDRFGAYLLAAFRPEKASWFEFHAQADVLRNLAKSWTEYELSEGDDGSYTLSRVEYESDDSVQTAVTLGARLIGGKDDWFSATLDCRFPLERGDADLKPKILSRVQVRF